MDTHNSGVVEEIVDAPAAQQRPHLSGSCLDRWRAPNVELHQVQSALGALAARQCLELGGRRRVAAGRDDSVGCEREKLLDEL